MKSIGARLARAVNRVAGRSGPVLDGRYPHRSLRSPREVRRALAYLLLDARRHLAKRRNVKPSAVHVDGASSARWFDGWLPAATARIPEAIGDGRLNPPRPREGRRTEGLYGSCAPDTPRIGHRMFAPASELRGAAAITARTALDVYSNFRSGHHG